MSEEKTISIVVMKKAPSMQSVVVQVEEPKERPPVFVAVQLKKKEPVTGELPAEIKALWNKKSVINAKKKLEVLLRKFDSGICYDPVNKRVEDFKLGGKKR